MTAENPISSSIILLVIPLVNTWRRNSLSLDAVTLMASRNNGRWIHSHPVQQDHAESFKEQRQQSPSFFISFIKCRRGEKKVQFDDVTLYPDVCSCCNLMMFYGWCERVIMYLARQNSHSTIVLTFGNKVVLYWTIKKRLSVTHVEVYCCLRFLLLCVVLTVQQQNNKKYTKQQQHPSALSKKERKKKKKKKKKTKSAQFLSNIFLNYNTPMLLIINNKNKK